MSLYYENFKNRAFKILFDSWNPPSRYLMAGGWFSLFCILYWLKHVNNLCFHANFSHLMDYIGREQCKKSLINHIRINKLLIIKTCDYEKNIFFYECAAFSWNVLRL